MRAYGIVARVVGLAAAALVLAGQARAADEVKIAKGKGGSHLADGKGMALYTFKKDTPGKSACAGPCVTKWPVFYQEKVEVEGALKPSDFEAITRDDGKKQTTYKGMPLYYFADDRAPGDAKGEGVGGVWDLAKP